jgi:hypothetical protein
MRQALTIAFAGLMVAACSSLPTPILEKDEQTRSPKSTVAMLSDAAMLLDDLNHLGPQILRDVFHQTLGVVQDYVEIESGQRQELQDARYLTLRLYPKGKSRSEEHFTAEAWFRFSGKGDKGLSWDFQHSPSQNKATRPEDYL